MGKKVSRLEMAPMIAYREDIDRGPPLLANGVHRPQRNRHTGKYLDRQNGSALVLPCDGDANIPVAHGLAYDLEGLAGSIVGFA